MGVESISSGSSYMFRMTKHYVFLWDGKVFMDKAQKLKAQVPAFFFPPGFTTPVWFTAYLPSVSFNCHSYKIGIISSVNILQGDNIHQNPHITYHPDSQLRERERYEAWWIVSLLTLNQFSFQFGVGNENSALKTSIILWCFLQGVGTWESWYFKKWCCWVLE